MVTGYQNTMYSIIFKLLNTILKIKFEVLKVLDGEQEKYLLIPELLCKAIGVFEVFPK